MPMLKTYTIPNHHPDICHKQILWVTDIHEDSCTPESLNLFIEEIARHDAPAVLVGGDTSNGQKSLDFLEILAEKTGKSLYFVLGNHDFYGHKIHDIREKAFALSQRNPNIHYLSDGDVCSLSESTGLIGHDGWADGRVGDFIQSTVSLGDYFLIDDLKDREGKELLDILHQLGDEAAEILGNSLEKALKKFSKIIMITHVPPFKEVCCYHGMPCDDNWGPHFVCDAMGKKIFSLMKAHPDVEILVLCGHSHTNAEAQILPNVRAVAAESILGAPSIQGTVWFY